MILKEGKKKNHFFCCVFKVPVFSHVQPVVVAGPKSIKLYCGCGLRLCNLVIWATEQYKALSNSEESIPKLVQE